MSNEGFSATYLASALARPCRTCRAEAGQPCRPGRSVKSLAILAKRGVHLDRVPYTPSREARKRPGAWGPPPRRAGWSWRKAGVAR